MILFNVCAILLIIVQLLNGLIDCTKWHKTPIIRGSLIALFWLGLLTIFNKWN